MPILRPIAATTLTLSAVALAAAALWQPHRVAAQVEPAPNTVAFYTQRVQPIFQANCYSCHGGMNHRGGLNIATRAGMLKGGHDGSVLNLKTPEASMIITLIRHEGPADDPMPMPPPPRKKVSDADIATVTAWVKAGAVMPEDVPIKSSLVRPWIHPRHAVMPPQLVRIEQRP
jgi:mono/diheme cytochrome c family protein